MENPYIKKRLHDIEENYKDISERIACAAIESGREAYDVKLMAVTKTVEPIFINHAISLGANLLGENRVQEYLSKKSEINLHGCEVHLIGHLQTNKVRQIVGEVDMIDGVDSVKVAKEIGKVSERSEIVTNVLLEVNIAGEDSKFGFSPSELTEKIYEISEIRGIKVKGLMAVPPIIEENADNRQFFSNLNNLFIDITSKNIDNVSMEILSMGMSDDYESAILEGSNVVRIGSALFGERRY